MQDGTMIDEIQMRRSRRRQQQHLLDHPYYWSCTTAVKLVVAFLLLVVIAQLPMIALGLEEVIEEEEATTTTTTTTTTKHEEQQETEEVVSTMTEHAERSQYTLVNLHDNESDDKNAQLLSTLETANASMAAQQVLGRISHNLEQRLARIYEKATSAECRAKIGEHFSYYINAIGLEVDLPFAGITFTNECDEEVYPDYDNLPEGIHLGILQNRTYQPDDAEYLIDPFDLRLCYAILTHDNPAATIRLIEALYEEGHVFIVHVDGKESSEETFQHLWEYARTRSHVHILDHPFRVRVNWGGFSMVNATIQMLKYAFGMLDSSSSDEPSIPFFFHKFVHLASTSYPIASNTAIRQTIANYPLDANLMHVVMKPTRPDRQAWHYYVECDDAVHRIYQLPPLTIPTTGVEIYTSSQWFIISREFAHYVAAAEPGTFVHGLLEYMEHVVVADESFFGTVLRNTAFCSKHHNWNFLHLQFDRWENELEVDLRDPRKCLMPSPDHCGRSPTTMTMDYMDVLELTDGDLFARKFVDSVDSEIKDVIDQRRAEEEELLRAANGTWPLYIPPKVDLSFEGHGVLIVAKDTANDTKPLCLGLGESQNKVRLIPCFEDAIPATLAPGWETGAVIEEETLLHNRWTIGPCSSDGNVTRLPSATMQVTPGKYSRTGPRCMIRQIDGLRAGRCMDGESHRIQPGGGDAQVFPCTKRWHQFFSFGDGIIAPVGAILTTLPRQLLQRIHDSGREQDAHLCLGVRGRGNLDEATWDVDEGSVEQAPTASSPQLRKHANQTERDANETTWLPLSDWEGEQLVATRCSNVGGIIEWLFVPYIVEESSTQTGETVSDDEAIHNNESASILESEKSTSGEPPVLADGSSSVTISSEQTILVGSNEHQEL